MAGASIMALCARIIQSGENALERFPRSHSHKWDVRSRVPLRNLHKRLAPCGLNRGDKNVRCAEARNKFVRRQRVEGRETAVAVARLATALALSGFDGPTALLAKWIADHNNAHVFRSQDTRVPRSTAFARVETGGEPCLLNENN
jgi:hypothetical protein